MDAIQMLKNRKSVRQYLSEEIPMNILTDIIDCGRLAASGKNKQPLHFLLITDKSKLDKLSQICTYGKFLNTVPACIVVFSEQGNFSVEDSSAATQNILNAAFAYGYGSCWIAGYNRPYSLDVELFFNAPLGYRLMSIIAIGKPSEDEPRRPKKPLSEKLHINSF